MAPNSKAKVKKACEAMKVFGYTEKDVKPVLMNLLKLYNKNWELIEDESYSVLLESIIDSKKSTIRHLVDEPEEDEPPLKRSRMSSQGNHSSHYDPSPSADTCTSELQPPSKQKMAEFTTESYETEDVGSKPLTLLNHYQRKGGIEKQDLECLNSEHLGTEGNEEGTTNSSRLDIASSSKGEVNISFFYKPYSQSDFCPPSLDSVLKRVEEKYIKSYGFSQPGFDLLRLMENLCECYLTAGTKTRAANEPSAGIESQKLHPVGELHFASDIGSFKLSNLVKVLPQIPKFPASGNRDIMCYMVEFNGTKINGAGQEKVNKVLKLLKDITNGQEEHSRAGLPNVAYYIEDISNGQEEHRISFTNEYNHEILPIFKYIPKNVIFQNAYVKFLLARISDDNCCSSCSGDCVSQDIPCACAGETGGEFAYSSGGLLKEKFLESCISMNREPQKHGLVYCQDCPLERSKNNSMSGLCKGHLVRKFIKECWHKCGCSKGCGNRVVQRGIAVPLQVFMTADGKGWGLRALEDLPRGAFVCEYVGEIVTNTELYERNTQTADDKHTYPVLLDADWGSEGVLKDEEALCLDATSYGNVASQEITTHYMQQMFR
ncbi:hypothetical protein RND71_022578 [Anisodus tanguticus]|uniref:Uncharacterized protein n=1 Tax=Anisodus tanguticus TaxID=243964 RepID=A0AAE1RSA7_9SOLA|nr:hypothetical protein RND71_022578 [Anisodus tanguticus]